jgi:uncharacterized protein DUF6901
MAVDFNRAFNIHCRANKKGISYAKSGHLNLIGVFMDTTPYQIVYEFILSKNKRKRFHIRLDPETMSIMRPKAMALPEWTRLGYNQCRNCPLETTDHRHCAIAVNLFEIVEEFKDMSSYHDCIVRCATPERTYQKKTSITEGLFSVFGVITAASNCPRMDFFKPQPPVKGTP